MNAPPLRIGILGAGYWGPNLIRVFDQAVDAKVIAIADKDTDRLDRLATSYPSAEMMNDADALIARPDIDAIIVALPVSLHFEFARKILEAGKHCMVEKPLAQSSAECRHLIAAADAAGRVLMVGHTFEYNAAVRRVREEIDAGNLGDVLQIISQRLNLGQVRTDVDALWNLAPHDISIALYWLGHDAPKWVSAQGFAFIQQTVADMGTITIGFETGAVAHIVVSWLSPDKVRKVYVIGSRNMIVYDDVSPDAKVQIFDKGIDRVGASGESWSKHDDFAEFQLKLRSGDLLVPRIDFQEPLKVEANHFIECARTGATPLSDGISGFRVVQVLEAADQSIANGGIRIDLEPYSDGEN